MYNKYKCSSCLLNKKKNVEYSKIFYGAPFFSPKVKRLLYHEQEKWTLTDRHVLAPKTFCQGSATAIHRT